MTKSKIYIVDDNDELREVIREGLELDGYAVTAAANAGELLQQLKNGRADTILLDLGLPDGNGLDLIEKIRKCSDAPIIIVSGKAASVDRIVGLEMGADDYISKPFELRELSVRVKVCVRRYQAYKTQIRPETKQQPRKIKFGKWTLDSAQFQIFDDRNRSCNMTVQEFQVLEAFVLAPNRVLTREMLLEKSRTDGHEVFDRAIDIQIARIRKKIGDNAKAPEIIRTVRGAGYMLALKTEAVE